MLTSLHVAGHSLLHRIDARWKIALLFGVSIGLYLVDAWWVLGGALFAAIILYGNIGLTIAEALKRIRPALVTIFILCAFNAWFTSPSEAGAMALRLVTIVTLAAAVTASMTMAEFMDALTVLLRPLERIGLVNAADLSLALGLVLRFVPDVFSEYQAIKDAHAARGLPLRFHTTIGPLMVLTLKKADTVSEAIDARGIRQSASHKEINT